MTNRSASIGSLSKVAWGRLLIALLAIAVAHDAAGQPVSPLPPASNAASSRSQRFQLRQQQLSTFPASGPRGQIFVGYAAAGWTLPMGLAGPAFSAANGLQLSIRSEWPGAFGYRPVDVTVVANSPATSDVALEFRFTAASWNFGSNGIHVRKKFVLEQGQSETVVQVLVPHFADWQRFQWDLYVNGGRDEELAVTNAYAANLWQNAANAGADVAAIGVALDHSERYWATADIGLAYGNPSMTLEVFEPETLPTDWLGYTSLNTVVLPADELSRLVDEHPLQAEALLRWVATGGNLWLIDAGDKWQQLAGVEQLLGQREETTGDGAQDESADEQSDSAMSSDGLPPRWRFAPLNQRALEPAEGAVVLAGFPVDESASTKAESSAAANPPAASRFDNSNLALTSPVAGANLPKSSADWFAVRGWGLGAIAAFRQHLHGANDASNQEAVRVLGQSLLAPRQQWGGRFGSSPHDANIDFNDWLIPGVGMAPVGSFQVLITLFAIAIGPLTYWLLRRTGKLPMLVAVVPAAAAVTTVALFAYGILIDGVSAQVRGRSITLLDQRSGECAVWGRYSYYAGIAPRKGLAVPLDQGMFPILPNWSGIFDFGGNRAVQDREIIWDDRQRLTRGWLASRTPTQYHAIAARKTSKRLRIQSTPQGLRVTNQLGVEAVGVAIEDHDGKFYWCDNLPADNVIVLKPVKRTDVSSKVRILFTENLPELPAGDDGRRNRNYYNFGVSDSVMEGRLGAINSPQLEGWGPGRYIAFTTTAIELSTGIEGADEQRSFHVIEGSY